MGQFVLSTYEAVFYDDGLATNLFVLYQQESFPKYFYSQNIPWRTQGSVEAYCLVVTFVCINSHHPVH
jgi:hypothetical protein